MRSRLIVLFCLALLLPQSIASANPKADGLCLAKKCGMTLMACGLDNECRDWLQCILKCGDDKIRCPSTCGFYYQNTSINKTSHCVFDSQCVDVGFASLPAYDHQNRPKLDLSDVAGTFWFAAAASPAPIFDFDCQRFDFTPDRVKKGTLGVDFGVPLTLTGQERITKTHGRFTELPDGTIDVAYDNFAGYHEHWFIVGKTAQTIAAHVCIAAPTTCYDYGTLLLSKVPLDQLDTSELQRLKTLLQTLFSIDVTTMKTPEISACPNS